MLFFRKDMAFCRDRGTYAHEEAREVHVKACPFLPTRDALPQTTITVLFVLRDTRRSSAPLQEQNI